MTEHNDDLLALEAGARVHAAMRAENFGLDRQRMKAIANRQRRPEWLAVMDGNFVVRMVWGVRPCPSI